MYRNVYKYVYYLKIEYSLVLFCTVCYSMLY